MRQEPQRLSAWRPMNADRFFLGAAHYPEHVDESYWERDADRMVECGFNTVRLGEFAWHIFEPELGRYDFDLFDRAIEVLASRNIDTIMCTPTATPPRWLTKAQPELLRVDSRGHRARHGSRQQADTTLPGFREHSRRITEAMAKHYRNHPNVIGWQTDNEFNNTVAESYSEATCEQFRLFVKDRYKTIDNLNRAWGTVFWAQHYDHFDQIDVPFHLSPSFANPSQMLDFHRFLAVATAVFQRDQVEILRAVNPDWFIFHNVGQLRDLDLRGQLAEDLDFLGQDVYPMNRDEFFRAGSIARLQAFLSDAFRGWAGNFLVPEQQSGMGSQPGFTSANPEPGEMRRMAMSSIARGADGILFFRWRPAHFGAEIYWNGILDHDDIPRRRYEEAKRFGQDVAKIAPALKGTSVRMDVAIAGADYDNQEIAKTYPLAMPLPQDAAAVLHTYCYDRAISCGFAHPEDSLEKTKVFFVPHWLIWKDEWTAKLQTYVEAGGTLVIGARTGTRTEDNHIIREPSPGASLSALSGVKVEEFGPLPPLGGLGLADKIERSVGTIVLPTRPAESSKRLHTIKIGNRSLTAAEAYELLSLDDGTEVIGTWGSRFSAGQPAITSRRVGKGRVIYVGTFLTPELTEVLFGHILAEANVEPLVMDCPQGLELTLRERDGKRLLFAINGVSDALTVNGLSAGTDLLTGYRVDGTLTLDPYGCSVIQLD